MIEFVTGLVTMGFVASALFFLKFWKRTRDRLFLMFFIAFALFATEQCFLVWARAAREEQTWFYLLRLIGFVLIIAGVIGKNREADGRVPPG